MNATIKHVALYRMVQEEVSHYQLRNFICSKPRWSISQIKT